MYRYTYILLFILLILGCKTKKSAASSSEPAFGKKNKDAAFSSLLINAATEKVLANYTDAQELYNACISINPKCGVCYFELSEIHKIKREFQEAISDAEKAVSISPKNEWYKSNLALLYKETRNFAKAEDLYEDLVENHPKSSDYLLELAETMLYQDKVKEAIAVYDKLENLLGLNEELSIHKHRLYVQIGDDENAVKEIQKLIDKFPNEIRNYGVLAEYYENKGEPEKALEYYNKILEMEPNNGEVHLSLYDYYKFHSNPDKAFEELKTAFANPKVDIDTKVRILLDFITNGQRNDEVKKQSYELVNLLLNAHPDSPKSYTVYGDLLLNDNKEKESLEAFKKAVSFDDSKYAIWSQIIFLEFDLKKYDSLAVDSKKASELFPTQPSFYFYNGVANIKMKEYEMAIEALSAGKEYVLDNDELLSEFYQNLGDAYYNLKKYDDAFDSYDQSLTLKPHNPYLLNNYAYYLSLQKINLEKAAEMAEKANKINPNNANFLDTYGWVLFQMEKYSDAEVWIQKALDNGGNNSGAVLEHYGDVLFKLNKVSEAMEYWEKASQAGGGSDLLLRKLKEKQYFE